METNEEKAVDYSQLVNYAGFDSFKIDCQKAGQETSANLEGSGFKELAWSRGESAFVMEMPWAGNYLAHVEEGLGTKNVPADRMAKEVKGNKNFSDVFDLGLADSVQKLVGKSFYDEVAQCNVAMVINDLATSGARPLSFMLHLAVAKANWFNNKKRQQGLIKGTVRACNLAGCIWGGGETPVLKKIIALGSSLLSGSATGHISSEKRLINPVNIADGDAIVIFESSGPHANGYSMLWNVVAERLPKGYLTEIPCDGRTFGEAILAPTFIYSRLMQAILDAGVDIHYAINVTGHGWAKFMRAVQPFTYVIDKLPERQPLFDFIHQYNPIGWRKMYQTFNVGAGYAIYVAKKDVQKIVSIAEMLNCGFRVYEAGYIEKSDKKRVIIEPHAIEFGPADLDIR